MKCFSSQFTLPALFLFVTSVALFMAICGYTWRIPLRTGNIQAAVCTEKDWASITTTFSAATYASDGGITTWVFDIDDPSKLFMHMQSRPELWGNVAISNANTESRVHGRRSMLGWAAVNRSASRPIEGWRHGVFDSSDIALYQMQASGIFSATRLKPRHYFVDCFVRIVVQTDGDFRSDKEYRITYKGRKKLIVRSAPLDRQLVQLIIVDLQ